MAEDRKPTEKFPAVSLDGPTVPPVSPRAPVRVSVNPPSRPGLPRPSVVDPEWLREEDTSITRTTETCIEIAPQAREKNRATLTVINGVNAGQVFALQTGAETILGRGREVHVRLEDAGVSRRHTRITMTIAGQYVVEDAGSTNGTFLGGRRIDRGLLMPGDTIQCGPNVALTFALTDEKAEQLAKQLYESSTRDPLTQAFNRRYMSERLASEVAYANRHKSRLGVVLFDLDLFKKVNDEHGHLGGDEVLKAVSAQVSNMIRVEDVFARFGGEEFLVLVRGIEHANVAHFAERIRKSIERLAVHYGEARIRQTVSLGVASLDECGDIGTGEALLLLADERLYVAKGAGRNRVISA